MKRYLVTVLLAAVFIFGVSAGQAKTDGKMVIKEGSKVAFDYTLTVEGKVVDNSEDKGPLEYTHGDGKLIPGLTRQMEGLAVGDEKTVVVAPKEAYGEVDQAALREVPLTSLPKDIKPQPGMQLQATAPSGEVFPVRIAEVKQDSVVMDFNHPLAGKSLTFKVKVVSVK